MEQFLICVFLMAQGAFVYWAFQRIVSMIRPGINPEEQKTLGGVIGNGLFVSLMGNHDLTIEVMESFKHTKCYIPLMKATWEAFKKEKERFEEECEQHRSKEC